MSLQVLVPYDSREAMTLRDAAKLAGPVAKRQCGHGARSKTSGGAWPVARGACLGLLSKCFWTEMRRRWRPITRTIGMGRLWRCTMNGSGSARCCGRGSQHDQEKRAVFRLNEEEVRRIFESRCQRAVYGTGCPGAHTTRFVHLNSALNRPGIASPKHPLRTIRLPSSL